MSVEIRLPGADHPLRLAEPPSWDLELSPARSRVAFAAAHVVADPTSTTPGAGPGLDWEATLAYRRYLWGLGLGVADAMDTAQRGMGLDWPATRELIVRSGAEARAMGGRLACGAGTDQLVGGAASLAGVVEAYSEQVDVVETAGAQVVVMASRALAATARGPDDYHAVYSSVLGQVRDPVILHWLGPMFDPALTGYWGSPDLDVATESMLSLIAAHAHVVDGVKVSLLDAEREIAIRRALPEGVRLYTGDDFHYPELIRGDERGWSDALLGIFDAIAPAAAAALAALDRGDIATYDAVLAPTVPLARHIFAAPTYHYKTGIVFLAWLNGHQDHFALLGGLEQARSVEHLVELFRLADAAGMLLDPDLAASRLRTYLDRVGLAA
ncbi:MAG TPA: dihydrodipicolinate synthase family protein [Gaiellaceae bacterium]|nr:dihydrodipicolinate synthase family protein [Gaiellaceae bacterium]